MKEQKYIIENIDSFELKDIFDCGQCFRWNKEDDESYTGIFGENVLNVKKEEDKIIFQGICKNNIKETVESYFDLNRDYKRIKEELAKIDDNMKTSIEYGKGIRILNQDLWETIISFIISANNNIPRIKGIIERLSKKYGKEITGILKKVSDGTIFIECNGDIAKLNIADVANAHTVYDFSECFKQKDNVNLNKLNKFNKK